MYAAFNGNNGLRKYPACLWATAMSRICEMNKLTGGDQLDRYRRFSLLINFTMSVKKLQQYCTIMQNNGGFDKYFLKLYYIKQLCPISTEFIELISRI